MPMYRNPNADLRQYPENINHFMKDGEIIATGDGHGNGLRTLYTLMTEGIFAVSREDYEAFILLYGKDKHAHARGETHLKKEDIQILDAILARSTVIPEAKKGMIDFTGDRIADRGENDLFELKIMEKLHHEGVPFRIPISNHDLDFLKSFPDYHPMLGENQARSMYRLGRLVFDGIVNQKEVDRLVNIYQSHLNLFSYSFAENDELILYAHSPIDLRVIKGIAEKLNIPYPENDPTLKRPSNLDIAKLIEQMNKTFRQRITHKDTLFSLFCERLQWNKGWGYGPSQGYEYLPIDEQVRLNPFECVVWNRNIDDFYIPEGLHVVHGHTGPVKSTPQRTCIDTHLGKGFDLTTGEYRIFHSKNIS